MADLLLDSELNADQRELVDVIRKSGDNLMDIINDILDFSKIEAGKLVLTPSRFDIIPERAGSQRSSVLQVPGKTGSPCMSNFAPEVPRYAVGDALRLRQVLLNLVSNALKFTQQGHVLIRVASAPRADGAWPCASRWRIPASASRRTSWPRSSRNIRKAKKPRRGASAVPPRADHIEQAGRDDGRFDQRAKPAGDRFRSFNSRFCWRRPTQTQPSACDLSGLRLLLVDSSQAGADITRRYVLDWQMRCEDGVFAGTGAGDDVPGAPKPAIPTNSSSPTGRCWARHPMPGLPRSRA